MHHQAKSKNITLDFNFGPLAFTIHREAEASTTSQNLAACCAMGHASLMAYWPTQGACALHLSSTEGPQGRDRVKIGKIAVLLAGNIRQPFSNPYAVMILDMPSRSYIPSTPLSDGKYSINPCSEALFTDGRHRLFLSQALNATSIPVTINALSSNSTLGPELAPRSRFTREMAKISNKRLHFI
jgi:hypothetical protein